MRSRRNWEQIYRNSGSRLLGVIRRYVKDPFLAQDILHDSFILAIKKEGTFSSKGAFDGWLYRIVVNTTLQHLRVNKKEKVMSEGDFKRIDKPTESNNPYFIDKPMSAQLDLNEMLLAIDELPDHHKSVFNLYVMEKLKHKEIAEILGISAGTSKSHLARARKKIQANLLQRTNEKEEEEKKYKFAWLFVVPNWEGLMDQDFQSTFENFHVPLKGEIPSFIKNASTHSVFNKFLNYKLLVPIFSVITILVIINWPTGEDQKNIIAPISHPPVSNKNTEVLYEELEKKSDNRAETTHEKIQITPLKKEEKPSVLDTSLIKLTDFSHNKDTVRKKIIIKKEVIKRDTITILH